MAGSSSLEEALSLSASAVQIDVLFTDIQLNGLASAGWNVADSFRAARPEVAVVYTSGDSADRSRSVSGSVFIHKPYEPRQLLNTFCELVAA
jgi:two-component system, OmpR family, response regulator